MTQHEESVYLGMMWDNARVARGFVVGRERRDLSDDLTFRMALSHAMQRVCSIAKRLSPEFRDSMPTISWNELIGQQVHLIEDFANVDLDLLWKTATKDIPRLIEFLEIDGPPEPER
jgi:uncharacterized protein with HEPN domain